MRIFLPATLIAMLLPGCAASENFQQLTQEFDVPDYKVVLVLGSGDHGCVLGGATLQNKGNRPLNYVYTQMMVVSANGVTLNNFNINFPPTIQSGSAPAAAITTRSAVLTFAPCTSIQMHLSASSGMTNTLDRLASTISSSTPPNPPASLPPSPPRPSIPTSPECEKALAGNVDQQNALTKTFPNGGRYIGDMVAGVRSGHGKYIDPDGSEYSGGWVNDRRDGCGMVTTVSGQRSFGFFRDGALIH